MVVPGVAQVDASLTRSPRPCSRPSARPTSWAASRSRSPATPGWPSPAIRTPPSPSWSATPIRPSSRLATAGRASTSSTTRIAASSTTRTRGSAVLGPREPRVPAPLATHRAGGVPRAVRRGGPAEVAGAGGDQHRRHVPARLPSPAREVRPDRAGRAVGHRGGVAVRALAWEAKSHPSTPGLFVTCKSVRISWRCPTSTSRSCILARSGACHRNGPASTSPCGRSAAPTARRPGRRCAGLKDAGVKLGLGKLAPAWRRWPPCAIHAPGPRPHRPAPFRAGAGDEHGGSGPSSTRLQPGPSSA